MIQAWRVLRRSVIEFQSDRCGSMAAAIAYHALFSVVPVVAILVAAFGWILRDPAISRQVVDQVLQTLPIRSGLVVDAISAVSRASEPLSIVGLLAFAWAATGMFGTIRDSLNVVWGVKQSRGFFRAKLWDVVAVVSVAVLLAISIAGTTVLHGVRRASETRFERWSGSDYFWDTTGWLFPALITFVAFMLAYRYFPNVEHRFRDLWPGALVAAGLFEVAKHGFTFYVSHFSRYEVLYGALGAVMLFLLWIYVSASILLFGAELAAVYEQARRSRR